MKVLNLIINGIPSIPILVGAAGYAAYKVLNLIINGIPSILHTGKVCTIQLVRGSFKPYYKWNTFNTK